MIVIVGGGISGLSAAWFAQKRGLDYTLIESSERWGGKLRTEHVQLNKGERFVVEGGPDSFLVQKPWAVQLARELGLGDRLLGTNDQQRTIYVLHKGKPIPLPEGVLLIVPTQFMPFALTPLISIPGKLRMALDLVIPRRRDPADETLGAFVRRRLGQEALDRLAEPLMSGIYSAEADQQSLLATFPRFRQIETEHGSLIRGMLASRASAPKPVEGKKPSMFQSLPGGTQELVDALVPKLTGKLRLRTAAEQLTPDKAGGYQLTLSDGSTLAADHVVLTTPAAVAARLIESFDPQIAEALRTIRTVSTGTISLGYHKKDIQRSLDGFGVVIPRGEKRPINALTLSSVKFDQRAPEGYALVRVFFGGSRTPETLQLDDSAILALACAQLKDILGIEAPPLFHRIFRWRDANPQYDLGHLERMDILDSALPAGLHLTGCAYRGVGIPDCIKQAEDTIKKIPATP